MKKIILPLLLSITAFAFTQPKLVGPLTYSGTKEGGSVFRFDLPASSPGVIYSFDNLAPHRPTAGVCAGDGNWLYGMLSYNGTSSSGALYKIQRDGTGFTVLRNLAAQSSMIPYYHSDGFIYFIDGPGIKKMNTTTNAVTDVGGSTSRKPCSAGAILISETSAICQLPLMGRHTESSFPFSKFSEKIIFCACDGCCINNKQTITSNLKWSDFKLVFENTKVFDFEIAINRMKVVLL